MEFLLAAALLLGRYPPVFTLIIFGSVAAYVAFTLRSPTGGWSIAFDEPAGIAGR
jgi:hypothetical protein